MGEVNQEKKRKRFGLKAIIILLAVVVVILGAGMFYYVNGTSAVDYKSKEEVMVTIPRGTGAMQALNLLDDAGLVKNKFFSKVFVKLSGPEQIQVNTYVFKKSMSTEDMFEAMEKGDFDYILKSKFTVIEGATIPEAAEAIAQQFNIDKDSILQQWSNPDYLRSLIDKYWFITEDILNPDLMFPLEGYFYPETYYISDESPSIEQITTVMLDKMDQELTPMEDEIKTKLNMSVHQFLSFASVVQRESLFDEDRAKIAGVFKNRLDQNMMLQSDITVLYALQETRVAVTNQDLQVESKYNTYKYTGVPVGPVSSIPVNTMKDCLNYEENDYLYFFATKDGTVIYSKTYAEHMKAVNENKWY